MEKRSRKARRYVVRHPGMPTLDDLIQMYRAITGHDPDPADIERTRAQMELDAMRASTRTREM